MKKISLYFLFFLFIFSTGCKNSDAELEHSGFTVYKGATLFDGTGDEIENSIIVIKQGMLESVGDENSPIPDDSEVIDLSGKYITPGLIDAHVHLSATGLFDTRPGRVNEKYLDSVNSYISAKTWTKNNIEKYYEAYLRTGVTAVYDTGGSPWTLNLQKTAENNLNAPHVAASGTLITPAPQDFVSSINPPVEKEMIHLSSDSLGRKVVRYNTSMGSTGIKIWGLALGDKDFMNRMEAVADETREVQNKLIIHTHELDDAKAALQLGAKLLVHGVSHEVVDEEFINLVEENDALYIPNIGWKKATMYSMMALLGEAGDLDDPNRVLDARTLRRIQVPGEYIKSFDTVAAQKGLEGMRSDQFRKIEDSIPLINLKKLWKEGVTIVVGTDAGNPGILHGISYNEELEKMQEAGIPASDLIVMATRNGAMAMERLDDIGTLEKGKMADLIILEKDPSEDISNMRSITHVMRGGLLMSVKEKFE